MLGRTRSLVLFLALVSPAGAQSPGDKAVGLAPVKLSPISGQSGNAALFVGVNDFPEDRAISPLHFAVNDAISTAHLFVLELRLVPPDRARLALAGQPNGENAVRELAALKQAGVPIDFASKTKVLNLLHQVAMLPQDSADLLIVSLSSHGFEDKGIAYVMPSDGALNFLDDSAIRLTTVETTLGQSRAGKKLLILDACREKPTVGGKGGAAGMTRAFQEALASATGRAVLASCAEDQLSFEDDVNRHGVFTYYLLRALRGEAPAGDDGLLRIESVYTYVAGQVEGWSRMHRPDRLQKPWFKGAEDARKIPLALDAAKAAAVAEAARMQAAEIQARLEALKKLALEDAITVEQHQLGKQLLAADPSRLDARDRERLEYFIEVVTGKVPANRLQKLLDSVETPEQRAARLERERIAALVTSTIGRLEAAEGRRDGTEAYRLFDELKKLSPSHPSLPDWTKRLEKLEPPFIERGNELVLNLGGGVKMELVLIPAGAFMMGSPESEEDHQDDESPVHRVRIESPFYMGKYEVTQDQWTAVMGENPSTFKDCGGDCPVEQVSWEDCQTFCKKVSSRVGKKVRLPSEAEWEYACRAGTTTPFHFGRTISTDQANYDGNYTYGSGSKGEYREKTVSVGGFRPNAWGLYDMHGNVWEWCEDGYHENYSGAPTDGSAWNGGDGRVLRGGSWVGLPRYCRAAYRFRYSPGLRAVSFGCRVVVSGGVAGTP